MDPGRPQVDGPERPTGAAARALVVAIRFYQAARAGRPSPCRFWPSCSEYAVDALREHGATRGGWMVVRRLSRCRPWGGHGVDPIPAPAQMTARAAR